MRIVFYVPTNSLHHTSLNLSSKSRVLLANIFFLFTSTNCPLDDVDALFSELDIACFWLFFC